MSIELLYIPLIWLQYFVHSFIYHDQSETNIFAIFQWIYKYFCLVAIKQNTEEIKCKISENFCKKPWNIQRAIWFSKFQVFLSCASKCSNRFFKSKTVGSQPTTFDHINIKYIWGLGVLSRDPGPGSRFILTGIFIPGFLSNRGKSWEIIFHCLCIIFN